MLNTKKWYQSKTVWGIVLAATIAIANIFGVVPEALPEAVDKLVQLIALGFAVYGRLSAKASLK